MCGESAYRRGSVVPDSMTCSDTREMPVEQGSTCLAVDRRLPILAEVLCLFRVLRFPTGETKTGGTDGFVQGWA
jgi:hypothetical protein